MTLSLALIYIVLHLYSTDDSAKRHHPLLFSITDIYTLIEVDRKIINVTPNQHL